MVSGSLLTLGPYLYESSALIGRAKRDRLLVLERLLGRPAQPGEIIQKLAQLAGQRLVSLGGKPTSFSSFFVETKLRKTDLSLSPPHPALIEALSEKCPLKQAIPIIGLFTSEGLGFGAAFPELTEQMYRNLHENIDREGWTEARAAGLSVPECPPLSSALRTRNGR